MPFCSCARHSSAFGLPFPVLPASLSPVLASSARILGSTDIPVYLFISSSFTKKKKKLGMESCQTIKFLKYANILNLLHLSLAAFIRTLLSRLWVFSGFDHIQGLVFTCTQTNLSTIHISILVSDYCILFGVCDVRGTKSKRLHF